MCVLFNFLQLCAVQKIKQYAVKFFLNLFFVLDTYMNSYSRVTRRIVRMYVEIYTSCDLRARRKISDK